MSDPLDALRLVVSAVRAVVPTFDRRTLADLTDEELELVRQVVAAMIRERDEIVSSGSRVNRSRPT